MNELVYGGKIMKNYTITVNGTVYDVTVEEGTNVGAGTIVTKDLPAWALAITRSPLKILENWVNKQLNK